MNKTVEDVVSFNFVALPLPYHHFSFEVTKMLPYFIDMCIKTPGNCKVFDYVDFVYKY